MKKIFSIVIFMTIALLLSSCSDKLEKAILEGYRNSFADVGEQGIVSLDENDYNDIVRWFETYAEEKEDSAYYKGEDRWDIIRDVLESNAFNEDKIHRIDSTQWLGEIPHKPLAVDVYLDNTSSMKGYIMHNHDSDKTFLNVFTAIDDYLYQRKNFDDEEYREEDVTVRGFLTQRNKKMKKDELILVDWDGDGGLKDQLNHQRIAAFTDSYQLGDFLDSITSRIVSDNKFRHLAFFVTDGIPSGPNEKVTGTSWNLEEVGELKTQIRKIVHRLAVADMAVSLYHFNGLFYGKDCRYWYYDNSTAPVNKAIARPFYVLVMGDTDAVRHFQSASAGLKLFKPEHDVHFFNTEQELTVEVKDRDGSNAELKDDGYVFISNDNKIDFFVSIPLTSLPSFACDEESARQFVKIKVDGRDLPMKMEKECLVFGPEEMEKKTQKDINVTILNASPTWMVGQNIKDDKNEGYLHGTLNFSVFADGLREGYNGDITPLKERHLSVIRN